MRQMRHGTAPVSFWGIRQSNVLFLEVFFNKLSEVFFTFYAF
jgi:hypothetical protein